jgi:hypothetical protein
MKIVKKSSSHTDKDNVQGENFLMDSDSLSEARNLGKLLNSVDSGHSVQDPKVRLVSPYQMQLSEPGENPITERVPAHVHYCNTVSKMQLRLLYRSEASSHKNMLQRAPGLGRFVNQDWEKFRDFLLDMGPKPDPKRDHELDRIDNTDPEYDPGKCRWATSRVQNNNKGDTLVFIDSLTGKKWTASELAKRHGVTISAIEKRRSRGGWTDDESIEGGRRARFAQVPTPNATTVTPSVPNLLSTEGADSKLSLLACKAIGQIPEFRADFGQPKLQAAAIGQFDRLSRDGRGVLDADVGKRHVLASKGGLSPQANMKANKNSGCQRIGKDHFGRQIPVIPLISRGFLDDFGRLGMVEWCRLRDSNPRPPHYE